MEKKTLSVREVAELLGISRGAAYQAVRMGRIPSVRIGRRLLIPKAAIDRFLDDAGDVQFPSGAEESVC